jgi:hypothetical protein
MNNISVFFAPQLSNLAQASQVQAQLLTGNLSGLSLNLLLRFARI